MFSIALHHKKEIDETVLIKESQFKFNDNKSYIETPIINQQVGILRELKITTAVTDMKTKKEIASNSQEGLKIAPESSMVYNVPIKKMSPGNYLVQTEVEMPNKKIIKQSSHFTIGESIEKAQEITEKKVKKKGYSIYQLLSVIIVILIISVIVIRHCQKKNE